MQSFNERKHLHLHKSESQKISRGILLSFERSDSLNYQSMHKCACISQQISKTHEAHDTWCSYIELEEVRISISIHGA